MASPPRIKREEIPQLVKEEVQDGGIKTEVEDVEKLVDQTGSEAMESKEGLKARRATAIAGSYIRYY